MRMRLLWMSAAAALLLTLFYRVCTLNTFDSSWAPATGRLGNQHVVIQHIPRRPPQLDLMPLLPKDFDTWYDEQHHTPAGCRIVGEAVARALLTTKR